MKNFFLIFFTLLLNLVFSQSIDLTWEKPSLTNTYGENKAFIPNIQSNNNYIDEFNIPHFFLQEKISVPVDFTLDNIRTKKVPKTLLGDINFYDLPQQPVFFVKSMRAAKEFTKVIDVTGLYRDGGKVLQIISFDVNESVTRKNSLVSRTFSPISPVLSNRNGRFFKIKVDTTGVYKIDKTFLSQNGIPTDFNPSKFKIYGNGGMMLPEAPGKFRYKGLQENAIYAVGQEDGNFDDGDYFLFYAQGPDGINRNSSVSQSHSKNLYEDVAYYFINFEGSANGKRIQNLDITQDASQTLGDFDQVLFYEKDSVNVYNVGRQWFGKNFDLYNSFNVTFDGTGSISNALIDYRLLGVNAANINYSVSVNGSNVGTNTLTGGEFEISNSAQNFSGNYPLNINVTVNNSSNPSGSVYLDYLRLVFKQSLQFSSQQLGFRWFLTLTENQVYQFNISGNPEFVWDVSDRVNTKQLTSTGGAYKFFALNADFPNEFIAFNQAQALTPGFVGEIANQSLTSLSNVDYVIVTYPAYLAQAQKLALAHENVHDVRTAVVTTEQVYNEFSSGSQDISAIRDFFKYLYDTGTLKHALLFGDASYDYKDRIPNNTNRVPSYESFASKGLGNTYVTDDFFACLDDSDFTTNHPKSQEMDIAIGRLPASSLQEADLLLKKTLSYLNKASGFGSVFGDWRTKIMFVVDDDNEGAGNAFHHTVENRSASYIEQNLPQYTLRKLYTDAFLQEGSSGGVRYPAVTDAIVNGIETGTLLVNYFGHGGINGWAQERILTQNDIRNLTNFNTQYSRLPVFLTVTCDFTVWDIPQITSGGEMLIKEPEGGAVAMLTTSREIAVDYGKNVNDKIIKRLFQVSGGKYLPIGEALRLAKIDYDAGTQGLRVNLIGDPLISLARPPRSISINSINGEPAENFSGTLRALDFVSIEGTVLNANATAVDSQFNGELTGTLFDKKVQRTTLNNDGNIDPITYSEQVDAIYRGSTSVTNGQYKLEFYIPKDINFDVGNGKLTLYAHNNDIDGVASKSDVLVGDINPNGINDDKGPVVGLYMNNLNFANGGITDRSPYLLACVVDSTGINATGAGIGHDITQFLNENINSTTVLNQYFEGGDASPCINPDVKDFQKGRVYYKLRDLELGEHKVTFRVWDINNNSTTETLDFVVMDNGDQKLYINRLLNWPNPFTNQTYFHFEHNCPDALEVQVQVFTITGKLVKNIRQQVSSAPYREGYRTDKFAIPWDGLDDFGNKIGKGVYIYKTTVKGVNPESCKGTASETEKLVILK